MSLIPCPSCSVEISSDAPKCPHCGHGEAHRRLPRIRLSRWAVKTAVTLAAAALMIVVGAAATGELPGKDSPRTVAVNFTDDVRAKLLTQSGVEDALGDLGGDGVPDLQVELDSKQSLVATFDLQISDMTAKYTALQEHTRALNRNTQSLRAQRGEANSKRQQARAASFARAPLLGDVPVLSTMFDRKSASKEAEARLKDLHSESKNKADKKVEGYANQDAFADGRDAEKAGWREGRPKAPPAAPQDPAAPDLKLIRNGSLQFEVESFDSSFRRVEEIAREVGGYVSTVNRQKLSNGKVRGDVTLRVPADNFSRVMDMLRALGDLKNQNVSTLDITKVYVDLQSRKKNAETLEKRLLELIQGKGEVKDLLEVEKELAKVRERVERITGELKYYTDQITLSTISLILSEKDIEAPSESRTRWPSSRWWPGTSTGPTPGPRASSQM